MRLRGLLAVVVFVASLAVNADTLVYKAKVKGSEFQSGGSVASKVSVDLSGYIVFSRSGTGYGVPAFVVVDDKAKTYYVESLTNGKVELKSTTKGGELILTSDEWAVSGAVNSSTSVAKSLSGYLSWSRIYESGLQTMGSAKATLSYDRAKVPFGGETEGMAAAATAEDLLPGYTMVEHERPLQTVITSGVSSVNGLKGDVTFDKTTIGLDKVENKTSGEILSGVTADLIKSSLGFAPVSSSDVDKVVAGIKVTKSSLGLNNVENLSSSELVNSGTVIKAIGYTPQVAGNYATKFELKAVAASVSASVKSVNNRTGDVVLDSSDVGLGNVENLSSAEILSKLTAAYVVSALGYTPVDAVSAAAAAPVQSVNGKTGAVTIGASDVGLGNVSNLLNNYLGEADPAVTDDETKGYSIGSMWYNQCASPSRVYVCVGAVEGAAVWSMITAAEAVEEYVRTDHITGTFVHSIIADWDEGVARTPAVTALQKLRTYPANHENIVNKITCTDATSGNLDDLYRRFIKSETNPRKSDGTFTSSIVARANLDVYSTTESKGVFLQKANNLSDVANPATARANLGDGTATHVMHGDGTLTQVVTGDVTDLAVTTAKIADGAVDAAKLNDTITMSNSKVINFAAVGDTNGKGLILPTITGANPTNSITAGQVILRLDTGEMFVGTGAAVSSVGSTKVHDHSNAANGGNIPQSSVTGLVDDLAAEATARGNADTTLQGNIAAEATTRAGADTILQTNINGEAATRAAADTSESTTRANADTTLQTNITNEGTARAATDTSESTTRANADTTLQTNITNEGTARAAADTSEATTRASADTTLQTNITNEATARAAADTSEATTRANADTTLQTNINGEATTRANADTTHAALRTHLDSGDASGAGLTRPLTIDQTLFGGDRGMFVRGGNGLNNGVLAFGLNNGTSDVVTGTLYCGSSMTGGAGTERGAVAIATRAAGGALVNRIVFDETAVAITGNVTAANLGTLASKNTVTVSELGDSAVTTAKIYDSNVTAVKICDGNITATKLSCGAGADGYFLCMNGTALGWKAGTTTGLSSVTRDATLTGDGTAASPLGAAADMSTFTYIIDGYTTVAVKRNSVVKESVSGGLAQSAADGGYTRTTYIADGGVTGAKIADSNVTTAKIADGNVTAAKIADANVTTAKIADANVTAAKLSCGAAGDETSVLSYKTGVLTWVPKDSSFNSVVQYTNAANQTVTVTSANFGGLITVHNTHTAATGVVNIQFPSELCTAANVGKAVRVVGVASRDASFDSGALVIQATVGGAAGGFLNSFSNSAYVTRFVTDNADAGFPPEVHGVIVNVPGTGNYGWLIIGVDRDGWNKVSL